MSCSLRNGEEPTNDRRKRSAFRALCWAHCYLRARLRPPRRVTNPRRPGADGARRGGRIYVRINGNLDGPNPPIVLAHGGPGGTHASVMEALELSDARAVILYDQLDSGRSDQPNNPANWRVGRFVDELEAIRIALNIRRWYVLGHSWGGTIALEYGARRPVGLAGVVLASPLVSTRSWIADAKILVAQLPEADQRTLAACDGPGPPPDSACALATTQFYSRFNGREPASAARIAYRHPQDRGSIRVSTKRCGARASSSRPAR